MRDLLLVHVAGADGPQLRLTVDLSQQEHHEHIAPGGGFPDGAHPRFFGKGVSQDCRCSGENLLDLAAGNAVLAAFRPVPIVPVETRNLH